MSKFKLGKTRINSTDALVAAKSVATVIAHVSDMLQVIPARAAASVVLVILSTVQQIDTNKVACYRLARRSAKILIDLKVRMTGRWEDAPKALLENIEEFEKVLTCIRDFMQELTKVNWMGRLLKKGSIEEALSDFHDLLDEAERAFQIATLVEIHYTVGILDQRISGNARAPDAEEPNLEATTPEPTPPYSESRNIDMTNILEKLVIHEEPQLRTATCQNNATLEKAREDVDEIQLQEELKELDRLGFKRYHQTDLRLLCELKFSKSNTFWKGTVVADACGSRVLVKRYDSAAAGDKRNLKEWLHDVKILRNLHHPNLPQITGYSDEKAPVPFILLANSKLRDPCSFLLNALRQMTISESAIAAVKVYRDISSAALYVQRQLSLDERETQVFVSDASYALDTETGKIVVGVPYLKDAGFRGFGYPLTDSLLGRTFQLLPGGKSLDNDNSLDVVDLQDKLAHVRALAHVLLPCESPELSDISENLLEDGDGDCGVNSVSLSRIRRQTINAGMHEFAWTAGVHTASHSFAVGDIGYISRDRDRVSLTDSSRFNYFVKLANIIEDSDASCIGSEASGRLCIAREVNGTYGQWINGFHKTEEAWPFALPDDIEGWPISITTGSKLEVHVRHTARMASVNEAWRQLLREAKSIATKSGVEPHELILITKTVYGQVYKVNDWSPSRPTFFNHPAVSSHMHGSPLVPHAFSPHGNLPRILYLLTSHRSDFSPFLSDRPAPSAPPQGHYATRNVSLATTWCKPEGFINYIQLSSEDFQ